MNDEHITQLFYEGLDEKQLSPEQMAHLLTCSKCQQVSRSLQQFAAMTQAVGIIEAPAGFTNRWRVMAAKRAHTYQQRMPLKYWFFLIAANVISVLMLLGLLLINGQPIKTLVTGLIRVGNAYASLEETYSQAVHFLSGMPPIVPITMIIAFSVTIMILMVLGGAAFYRYGYKGTTHE